MGAEGETEASEQANPFMSTLNPEAAEFRPAAAAAESSRPSKPTEEAAPAARGPSLIFSGGGNFLSKYAQADQADAVPEQPLRRRGADPGAAPSGPDRVNVQLNQQFVNARMPEKILQVVDENFDQLNAVNLITALHRMATLAAGNKKASVRRDGRFKRLITRLSDVVRTTELYVLKPQDLSNVAWALTKLGILNSVLFGLLSERILLRINSFEPVNLSMTLWAFARSGFLDERLFRAAAEEVNLKLPDFQPQQIANTTWAMAKSNFVDEELFAKAAEQAIERLDEFQPMNFSMLLYSFALAKQPHQKLFDEVAKRCTVKTLSRSISVPHVVSNLALAFAEAGIQNIAVYDAVAKVAGDNLYDFRTQQIVTLAQAFATGQVQNQQLFRCITKSVANRAPEFREQELQDLLAAYESLGISRTELDRAIAAGEQTEDARQSDQTYSFILAVVLAVLLALASWQIRHD
eukprot:gb/GFBE01015971.1/.p1 GENE.gb/GFBE01015971.1/~~gb/GFBE01015971.1/.p1  ORF type:complete len:465 (+),score=110.02 gb/GFBE01015971.1/:1-1395(+)